MTPNLEVVVGTYEQFLLGYTVDDVVNKYKMEYTFATHSHLASIRSVACNKHYLASAAADDTVCLYDMRTRAESGKLIHHNDTVNSIAFTPDASHLITTSSDGTIGIVRCGSWQLEKHWLKPHKGLAVDTLAVHPSGKLAMTTGHDGVLRTWNLVKGRQAYATNLVPRWKAEAKNISVLKWSPCGNRYLIAADMKLDIYSIETAGVEKELAFGSKIASVEYLGDEYIAVGLADGRIIIYNLEKSTSTEEQAHDARVKCLAKNRDILVSASSSGEIKVWLYEKDKLKFLNKVNCSARISCLALNSCENLKSKKEEVDLEEKVAEKPSNKLRLKQQVIIEEENNEEKKTRMSKKKRNKLRARRLEEEANADNKNTQIVKKAKTKNSAVSLPKKHKSQDSEEVVESPKKKKKVPDFPKKRKEPQNEDDEIAQLPVKKKKQKENLVKKADQVKKSSAKVTKNKRKNPPEDTIETSPKKQKVIKSTVENKILKKKKKKKNIN